MIENDMCLVRFYGIVSDRILSLNIKDKYLSEKISMFEKQDIDPARLEKFKDNRSSLRNIEDIKKLDGSIYTRTVSDENSMQYGKIIENIRSALNSDKLSSSKNRRIILRIVNSFSKYNASLSDSSLDVSCLALIHYYDDCPRIMFRASDIENEIIPDMVTIMRFFIQPVYGSQKIKLAYFSSTCQNISKFSSKMQELSDILKGEKIDIY